MVRSIFHSPGLASHRWLPLSSNVRRPKNTLGHHPAMSTLSREQLQFLRDQGISLSQVYDGSGLRAKDRREKMEAHGANFYYGGAPCQAAGHTLRTKPGHCIQCDTSKIAYQLRHSASGYVYLAYSRVKQYAKIGFSQTPPDERVTFLRREAYGTASDWELTKTAFLAEGAGRKEFAIHALLDKHQKPVIYEKYPGIFVECREIFSCSQQVATIAFENVLRVK